MLFKFVKVYGLSFNAVFLTTALLTPPVLVWFWKQDTCSLKSFSKRVSVNSWCAAASSIFSLSLESALFRELIVMMILMQACAI